MFKSNHCDKSVVVPSLCFRYAFASIAVLSLRFRWHAQICSSVNSSWLGYPLALSIDINDVTSIFVQVMATMILNTCCKFIWYKIKLMIRCFTMSLLSHILLLSVIFLHLQLKLHMFYKPTIIKSCIYMPNKYINITVFSMLYGPYEPYECSPVRSIIYRWIWFLVKVLTDINRAAIRRFLYLVIGQL